MAGVGPTLDEASIARSWSELRDLVQRHGPEAPQTREAQARFDSELSAWQRAAQEAAERGDFSFSEVAIRYAELANTLPGVAVVPTTSVGSTPSPHMETTMSGTPSTAPDKEKKKKKEKKKRKSPRVTTFPGWDDLGGPTGELSFGPGEVAQAQEAMDGWGGAISPAGPEWGAEVPPAWPVAEPEPAPAAAADWGTPVPDPGLRTPRAGKRERHKPPPPIAVEPTPAPAPAPATGTGFPPAVDAFSSPAPQAMFATLQEEKLQLQNQLDRLGEDLQEAQQKALAAEAQLAEKDSVLSQTRQRLFDAQAHIAKLEEELKSQEQVQQSLQGRLQTARAEQLASQEEMQTMRRSVTAMLGTLPAYAERGSNVPYGTVTAPRSISPHVNTTPRRGLGVSDQDELATATDIPQMRPTGSPEKVSQFGSTNGSAVTKLPRSSQEAWRQTPRINKRVGALVAQTPAAPPEIVEQTNSNFRDILTDGQGTLYESHQVLLRMQTAVVGQGGRLSISCDLTAVSKTTSILQDLRISVTKQTEFSQLHIEPEGEGATLHRQQQARFRGRLDITGPFEAAPQVLLSYVLNDGFTVRARLRLPLAITRLMQPHRISHAEAIELWDSLDFVKAEVAVICTVRASLLSSGAPFSVWRCLQFGNAMVSIPGLDENSRGTVFAGSYPQASGTGVVLMRAELGGASTQSGTAGLGLPYGEASACRLAVRSVSHPVNRAVAQAALDVICTVPNVAIVA